MDKKVAQVSRHWSYQYFQENILVEFCLDVVMELLYSFINMGQLHVFFSIKQKLDMGLFVDFCVFTLI